MSRTSRARKLAALTNVGYQHTLQHLDGLSLSVGDEKGYVESLQGGRPVHRQTCACGKQFFTVSAGATMCPRCARAPVEPAGPAASAPKSIQESLRRMLEQYQKCREARQWLVGVMLHREPRVREP